MGDIWVTRVSGPGAVLHGEATLFAAWRRLQDGRWKMVGTYWSLTEAKKEIASQR